MVKGISRQVIVVHSPDQKLFDQAIFILKDEAVGKEGVTDEMLLKAANKLLTSASPDRKVPLTSYGAVWACAGALVTGLAWFLTVMF
ncbi:MAG: translation initiation factor 2 [Oscillospiraceae bacterium]|nr:translation initiation factor 2 [Oscillospiraceae bacterium]